MLLEKDAASANAVTRTCHSNLFVSGSQIMVEYGLSIALATPRLGLPKVSVG